MTGKQLAHMENVITRFARAFREKYLAGQRSHGGDVWTKPGMLTAACEENLDQACYLDVVKEQIRDTAAGLRSGAFTAEQAAERLERMLA